LVRILFILVTFDTGGSERVVFDICRKLDRERFSPMVVAFSDGPLRKRFEALEIPAKAILKQPGIDFRLMGKLARLMTENEIDIINTHHFVTLFYAFWGAKVAGRRALFHTEHSVWEMTGSRPFWQAVGRRLMRRCDGTIAVSRAVHEHLAAQGARSHFLPNGIELALFGRSLNGAKRAELGLAEEDRVIGIVGNLRPEKNHLGLLRAFAKVAEGMERARLVVVGDGVMRPALEEEAQRLGLGERVRFLGRRFDAPQLYRAFDVYCLPSKNEGMPLTVLEAMASGLPVVGTDVLGIGDLLRESGAGVLVPYGDDGALAAALTGLLSDGERARELAGAGLDYVRREHDLEAKVRQYEALFAGAVKAS